MTINKSPLRAMEVKGDEKIEYTRAKTQVKKPNGVRAAVPDRR